MPVLSSSKVLEALYDIHTRMEYPENLDPNEVWCALRLAWMDASYPYLI